MVTRVVRHKWLKERAMKGCWLVLRIDDYNKSPASRGQLYPDIPRTDDANKALWPTEELALDAAKWAAEKWGHTYGVFKMNAILERAVMPVKVVRV